jgi:formylglycine-generating enzyme required for sulfatase activity
MSDCGARSESCCTTLAVTGGAFYRAYSYDIYGIGPTPGSEADPASVSSFLLDKYEVTVGRFRQFVAAWTGGWRPPVGSGKHTYLNGGSGLTATGGGYEPGWLASDDNNVAPTSANLACDAGYATWTPSAGGNENLPVNCVNWYESYAFCIWDAAFLPTEAEWECAAVGGSQQLEYPWGSTEPGTSSQYAIYNCYYPSGSRDASSASCTGVMNIAPVGTAALGAGLWGQLDLVGNVKEWSLDSYASGPPCTDCANLPSLARELHGGAFNDPSVLLNPAEYYNPFLVYTFRKSNIGFRCARSPCPQ